jgi:pentatricopeptide repeat protein
MRRSAPGGLEPNAYTYSALLKTMGEQGRWQMAERFFRELEAEQLEMMAREAGGAEAATAPARRGAAAAAAAAAEAPPAPAFPGMSKAAPAGGHSSPGAIAAAAAAVAAMAAARQRQLAEGGASATLLEQLPLLRLGPGEALQAAVDAGQEAPPGTPFSYFSGSSRKAAAAAAPDTGSPVSVADAAAASGAWTSDNAAVRGLSLHLEDLASPPAALGSSNILPAGQRLRPLPKGRGPVNEVVCGALMLAYERAGRWQEAVAVLDRAEVLGEWPPRPALGPACLPVCVVAAPLRMAHSQPQLRLSPAAALPWLSTSHTPHPTSRLLVWTSTLSPHPLSAPPPGIAPNTIMFNTAMSALGKALQVEAAEALFARMPAPDAVSHETLIAAYGMSGLADKAEAAFERMRKAGGAARKLLAALCSAAASPPHVGAWCPGCGSLWTLPGQ